MSAANASRTQDAAPPAAESAAETLLHLGALLPLGYTLPVLPLGHILGLPSAEARTRLADDLLAEGLLQRDGDGLLLTAAGHARGTQPAPTRDLLRVSFLERAIAVATDAAQLYQMHRDAPESGDEVAALAGELLAQLSLRVFVNTPGLRRSKRFFQRLPALLAGLAGETSEAAFCQQLHLLAADSGFGALAGSARERLATLQVPHFILLWHLPARSAAQSAGHGTEVRDIALALDDGFGVSADAEGRLLVWSVASGQVHTVFGGLQHGISTLALGAPGEILAGGVDGSLRIYRLPAEVALPLQASRPAWEAGVDAARLYALTDDRMLLVYDPAASSPRLRLHLPLPLSVLAAAPGGRLLVGGDADGALWAWRYVEPQPPQS
jgi:hypothetical protein